MPLSEESPPDKIMIRQSYLAIKAHALTDRARARHVRPHRERFAYLAEAERDLGGCPSNGIHPSLSPLSALRNTVPGHGPGPLAQRAFLARMGVRARRQELRAQVTATTARPRSGRRRSDSWTLPAWAEREHAAADAGGVWPFLDAPSG
ncbi:hypothetical protein GGX14DRAFT_405091 [Mycena pura]|uniref:Uncharacterized protein n=1 Tax=Mycena pura TaxID=153505 RepID=A0AAD6USP7_9AGAR|nr:hypothetical protein GGX14DRAFT_405091 [Mycena pura]